MTGPVRDLSGVSKMWTRKIRSASAESSAATHIGPTRNSLPKDIRDQTTLIRAGHILTVLVPRDL